MPEGETLPKSNKSADWLKSADDKMKELRDYAGHRRVFGLQSRPTPADPVYKALSDKYQMLYKKGMDLQRKEQATPGSFRKGGKVKKSGLALVHKDEMIVKRQSTRRNKRR